MITRYFLAHPASVEETYGEQAKFAFGISLRLFAAAGAALVHSVLPLMFEKTASRIVGDLYARTHNRGQ